MFVDYIQRVAAIIATPDWLRPGMQDLFQPGTLLAHGESVFCANLPTVREL